MSKIIYIDDGRANMRIRAALLALANDRNLEIRIPAEPTEPIAKLTEPKILERAIRARREIAKKNL